MCGIVGVAGFIGPKEKSAFKRMLELDTGRGPDSTGIISVDRMGKVQYDKQLGTPWDFFKNTQVFKNKELGYELRALIGHNRWATRGEVNAENAHPFDFEGLIGVHNGTLDYRCYEYMRQNGGNYNVDSQMLFATIDKMGLKTAINNVAGAWSVVYWDKDANSLNFLRNDQRPMHYAFSKDKRTLFFASEAWMIFVACEQSGIEVMKSVSTQPDKKYELAFQVNSSVPNELPFVVYDEELKGHTFPEVRTHYTWESYGTSSTPSWKEQEEADKKVIASLSDEDGSIPVYFDKTHSSFERLSMSSSITLRAVLGEWNVRMYFNSVKEGEDVFSKADNDSSWFTLKSKFISRIPRADGKKEVYLVGVKDSLEGPFPWEDLFNDPSYSQPVEEVEEEQKVIYLPKSDQSMDVGGKMLSRARFLEIVRQEGCSCCGDNTLTWEDRHKVVWLDFPKSFVCDKECSDSLPGNPHVNFYSF